MLFAGPSGTAKTMAAEILAAELGLDLCRIDLAGVVSKWIGETEKKLYRVFRAVEGSNAILFFDESDALFGKRSEVKDRATVAACEHGRTADRAPLRTQRLTFHVAAWLLGCPGASRGGDRGMRDRG